MPAAALTQLTVKRVIGASRLRRLLRAGWLAPIGRSGNAILFDPRDVHAALRKLERRFCPPDQIEVARVRASEKRNGHGYVPKPRSKPPGLDQIDVDFSEFNH